MEAFLPLRRNKIELIRLQPPSPIEHTILFLEQSDGDDQRPEKEEESVVQVGSKEYLEGFISSPIEDQTVPERGTGLEQALKLGGTVSLALIALFLAFMASNGLLFQ